MLRPALLVIALQAALPALEAASTMDSTGSLIRPAEPLEESAGRKTVVAAPLGWQPWQVPSNPVDASRVRYSTARDRTFLELDFGPDAPTRAPKAAHLDDPPRAFFDVDFEGEEAPRAVELLTDEITGIRFGLPSGPGGRILRCVIDLRDARVRIRAIDLVDGKLVVEIGGP